MSKTRKSTRRCERCNVVGVVGCCTWCREWWCAACAKTHRCKWGVDA